MRIMAAHMSTGRSKQFQHLGHGWCQRFAVGCTSLAASTALHRPSERATDTVSGTCSLRCLAARRQPSAATVSHWLRLSPVAGSGGAERALRCQLLWLTLAGGAAPYCSRSRGLLGQPVSW